MANRNLRSRLASEIQETFVVLSVLFERTVQNEKVFSDPRTSWFPRIFDILKNGLRVFLDLLNVESFQDNIGILYRV